MRYHSQRDCWTERLLFSCCTYLKCNSNRLIDKLTVRITLTCSNIVRKLCCIYHWHIIPNLPQGQQPSTKKQLLQLLKSNSCCRSSSPLQQQQQISFYLRSFSAWQLGVRPHTHTPHTQTDWLHVYLFYVSFTRGKKSETWYKYALGVKFLFELSTFLLLQLLHKKMKISFTLSLHVAKLVYILHPGGVCHWQSSRSQSPARAVHGTVVGIRMWYIRIEMRFKTL